MPAKTIASPTSPLSRRARIAGLLAEKVAVEALLIGQEFLECLPRNGRLRGDVLAKIRLELRRGGNLLHDPFPVVGGLLGRALGNGDPARHIWKGGTSPALSWWSRPAFREAVVPEHADSPHCPGP